MCGDSNLTKLHRLIDDSLSPYTETDDVSVTKEREILVSLSQVLRQVKLWSEELDSDSDSGVGLECGDDCMCLIKILTHLIVLLTVESRFVKHLACNVLGVVSEFMVASGNHWDDFIRMLCDCIDCAITGASDFCSSSSSLILALKAKVKNGDWSVATGVIRVLRDVLKYLKPEDDDELVEMFIGAVNSFILRVPWDLLHEICVSSSRGDVSFQRTLFLGNLIQFLCSLVDQGGVVEAASRSLGKHHPVFSTIINLVPQLLGLCLGEKAECVISNNCSYHYFKHKLLMLMIRLIDQTCPESSILVSWLQLIHSYFEELLRQPIATLERSQEDCLEGSPFLSSVFDSEVNSLPSRHLQRQTVFLFLRCSFSLINSKRDTGRTCACASWNLCLDYDSNAELQCCGRKEGLSELYNWLQEHLPTDMLVDHEMYFEKSAEFAKSFLQLYIKEDDVLFKVLLLLLCVPCPLEKQFGEDKEPFQGSKGNALFFVSDLFSPVLLFHLFLLELSYDHQVLLDYLISKDTGITCAEYLLRCLRKVCGSWTLFVEFPLSGQAAYQSSCKKRKVSLNESSLCGGDLFGPVKDCGGSILEDEKKFDCKHTQENFREAKECLLSLKYLIESLHQKNLFPYNPNALLNRLTRFQELCLEEEK